MEKPWDTPREMIEKKWWVFPIYVGLYLLEDDIKDISGAKVSHLNGDGKREEKTMLKETTYNVNVPLYFQWISVALTLAFRSSQKTHRRYIT